MKKILIPLTVLICACSNTGNDTTSAAAAPAESEPAAIQQTDTLATATAAESESYAATEAGIDAASGATSVPNQTSFNGILVIPPQNRATVTLTIRSISLLPGAYVKKGSVLATLENPDFIALQQSYLDSHAQNEYLRTEFERQQTLSREEASSQKRYQQSKAEYLSMRSRMDTAAAQLALLGIDTTQLLANGIVPYLEVKSPISGYAANVNMNIGRHFDVGEPLCDIANLFECMAMFYFVKGLSLRIVTIPWKEKMLILLFVRFICVHLHQIKVV